MYIDNTFSNDFFYGFYGRNFKRLMIVTTVPNATVTLVAGSYVQRDNYIVVPSGTIVSYTVSAIGYQTVSDTITVNDNQELQVSMEELMVTLTVNATPSGASVTMTSEGYEQSGNTITVQQGKSAGCSVVLDGYTTYEFSITLMENTTISVPLAGYRLTIDPIPAEANVQLTASGFAQSGNLILVSSGTATGYDVSASGYFPESGTVTVTANTTLPVTLTEEATLTVDPTPPDANVEINVTGYEQEGNSILVPAGSTGTLTVTAGGYQDYGPATITISATETLSIVLDPIE